MLVLTRKHDEEIVIGEEGNEITITILKIQGSEKVSIGIKAHPKTPIFRKELLNRNADRNKDDKKRKLNPSATHQDIDLLIEAVQISTEKQDKEPEMIRSNQEYNCYLP